MESVRSFALIMGVIAALLLGPPAGLEVLSWPTVNRYATHVYKDWSWVGQVLVFLSVVAAIGAMAFMAAMFAGNGAAVTLTWIGMRTNPAVLFLAVLLALVAGLAFFANNRGM